MRRLQKALEFIASTILSAILLLGLGFVTDARARMSAEASSQLIERGTPFLFRMLQEIGELRTDTTYAARLDVKSNELFVSDVSRRRAASRPYRTESRVLRLWGAPFVWSKDGNGPCLMSARENASGCAAIILSPLVPDNLNVRGDVVDIGARRLIDQVALHMKNPNAVVTRGRACPRDASVKMEHLAHRFLADVLYVNATVLPFITDPRLFDAASEAVDAAITELLKSEPTTRTSYTRCFGGLDLITAFQVARALHRQFEYNPDPRITAYLKRLWSNAVDEGAIKAFGANNSENGTKYANAFTAYLHLAVILEEHGVRALQLYTYRGIEFLLEQQTNAPRQRRCTDKFGNFVQLPGGWPHSDEECSQNMGYHNFIVQALMAAHKHFQASGRCRNDAPALCRRMLASIDAAREWIDAMSPDRSGGDMLDRAAGTSKTESKSGSGNITGSYTGFEIIAYRGVPSARSRQMYIRAMEATIAARTNLLPIGSYLRAIAAEAGRRQ